MENVFMIHQYNEKTKWFFDSMIFQSYQMIRKLSIRFQRNPGFTLTSERFSKFFSLKMFEIKLSSGPFVSRFSRFTDKARNQLTKKIFGIFFIRIFFRWKNILYAELKF